MNLIKQRFERIKNLKSIQFEPDFALTSLSILIFGIFTGIGVTVQLILYPETNRLFMVAAAGVGLMSLSIMSIFPIWLVAVQNSLMFALAGLVFQNGFLWVDDNAVALFISIGLGILLAPAFQLVYQWDKIVVLRLGQFRKVHGPGIFFLLPLLDRIAAFVDTRIRATDFSAEKTITSDTVPVHVDALTFWMIWDAKKAVLEVENYIEAVVLSAQTALRDSIGRHDLATLLSEREKLGQEIQRILDAKTNPWGITILSIEFTDIIIPQGLEDAMSKRAQAERERQSRVILSAAEVEIARKFREASAVYDGNKDALQLRAMNMVYEGIRQKGSLMLLPASVLDNMNMGAVMGTTAMQKIMELQETDEPGDTPAT